MEKCSVTAGPTHRFALGNCYHEGATTAEHGCGDSRERIPERIDEQIVETEMSLEAVLASVTRVLQLETVEPRDRRTHCLGRVHLLVQGHRHISQDPK